MPRFSYTVKNPQGETIKAETEAYDKTSLIQQLQAKGLFIINIQEMLQGLQPTENIQEQRLSLKKFEHKNIILNDLLTFSRQLTTMLEAGVTLLRSLEVITGQVESEKFYKVLNNVTRDVEQGRSLSESLARHPKVFNQFWVSLVEVGEASGTMPMVLSKLAFYLEQQAAFKSIIVSAIMYPAILFFICMGAVAFFALFVGPRFETIFQSMGVDLPLITRVLLGSFRFIKENFLSLIGGSMGLFFILRQWSHTKTGRLQIEKIFYSLPTIGKIFRLIIIERFTSQMSILVDSGVPILYALDISQRLVDNITCSQVINDIKESVRRGELLVGPMKRSGFFPSMAIQMITVGEETGELGKMLKHVASFYQSTVETFMKRLGTVIEPFMLVFMGAIIGIIVLAMFLPMFNIAQLGGASH
jgi:type IV pilus assembly protein PilC